MIPFSADEIKHIYERRGYTVKMVYINHGEITVETMNETFKFGNKLNHHMRWRESFDDQEGWFDIKGLKKEIKRIQALIDDDEDGEATIYSIVKGEDVTEQFVK